MKVRSHELEVLAAFVHGTLAAFHLLGIVYNERRGNKFDVAVHSVGLCYDLRCVHKHYKAMKGLQHDLPPSRH